MRDQEAEMLGDLFLRAGELPPEERRDFIEQECAARNVRKSHAGYASSLSNPFFGDQASHAALDCAEARIEFELAQTRKMLGALAMQWGPIGLRL